MKKDLAQRIAGPLISILLASLAGMLVIALIGEDPFASFGLIFRGAFGSASNIATTVSKMTTLTLAGLSCAFAFRGGLVNIGAEGQIYAGALGSTLVVLFCPGPAPLVIILALAAGFLFGGLCGLLTAALKVFFGANEVITTVMMNYVCQYLVLYMVSGPIQAPGNSAAQTVTFDEAYWLPWLKADIKLHCGVLIMAACLIFYGIYVTRTRGGFAMRMVGQGSRAALCAGIDVNRTRLLTMFIAGGFAGLAGAVEVLGVQHRLLKGVASNYGFDGIAVALLGAGSPIGMFFSGILIGALMSGGNSLQMFSHVPSSAADLIRALVIIFVLIDVFGRFCRRKKREKEEMGS